MIQCYGMEKKTHEFYNSTRALREEAQREDENMDAILNFCTGGLYNHFRSRNQPEEQPTHYFSQRSTRTLHQQSPKEKEDQNLLSDEDEELLDSCYQDECRRKFYDTIEKSDDLSASSQQFLWQAKKERSSILGSCISIMTCPSMRSFLGLITSGFTCCIGIKSLLNQNGNKKFGLSTTIVGATGSTAMLYDLYDRLLNQ